MKRLVDCPVSQFKSRVKEHEIVQNTVDLHEHVVYKWAASVSSLQLALPEYQKWLAIESDLKDSNRKKYNQ